MVTIVLAIFICIVGYYVLTAPDRRSPGEKIGDAINELGDRTPGERINDAMKDK
jgi:hypothetical protein